MGIPVMILKQYKYRNLIFWAEKGLVRIEDQRTGSFHTVTRREALLRIKAINDGLYLEKYSDEKAEQQRMVEDMIECVKTAKSQGDPMDPLVMKHFGKEIKRTRAAKILLPNSSPCEEPLPLNKLPQGRPGITTVKEHKNLPKLDTNDISICQGGPDALS